MKKFKITVVDNRDDIVVDIITVSESVVLKQDPRKEMHHMRANAIDIAKRRYAAKYNMGLDKASSTYRYVCEAK